MSPSPADTRQQNRGRPAPVLPYPSLERLLGPAKEIVVDWQMPSDAERKG